jgi:hypothetical protein
MATKEMITLWFPRLLCIGAILFVSMFALDAFEPGTPFIQQLQDFIMHLIPSLVLIILLFIAWKWKLTGGILFTIIGLGVSPIVYSMNFHRTHSVWVSLSIILMVTFPFIVAGIFFILSHYQVKRRS